MANRRDDSIGRWWDRSLTLVKGCTWPEGEMPPACERCWARSMARRFRPGELEGVQASTHNLYLPRRVRKPTTFAVQIAYGDLFHPDIPPEFALEAFKEAYNGAVFVGHRFVFLTKRPKRAAGYVANWGRNYHRNILLLASCWDQGSVDATCAAFAGLPTGMRWGIHYEPALGPAVIPPGASWIVVGGETGPGARPMHPDWVRSIRDQCAAAGVAFYFKGWGDWMPIGGVYEEREVPGDPGTVDGDWPLEEAVSWQQNGKRVEAVEPSGYIANKNYQPLLGSCWMVRVGKKRAGRTLDGLEHNAVPWEAPR